MGQIFPPWTPEQVEALNAWQNTAHLCPFTCPTHSDQALVATVNGWVCSEPSCSYKQNWAHDFMAAPRNLKLFVAALLIERGLSCDCCVMVTNVCAHVYAKDEEHARELIKKHDPHASVKIKSLYERGEAEKVEYPGVIIAWSSLVYHGYYGDSPFRKE